MARRSREKPGFSTPKHSFAVASYIKHEIVKTTMKNDVMFRFQHIPRQAAPHQAENDRPASRPLRLYGPGLLLLMLAFMAFWPARPALAQDAPTPSAIEEAAAAAAAAGITANDVNAVAQELWCPLCSGVRLDVCELKACEQMREEIAIKLSEGEDTESIKRYFVRQYGPQVLGEPPKEGFNLLGWILPIVVFVGGGVFVTARIMRMRKNRREEEDEESAAVQHASAANEGDAYADRLDEELTHYD
jgi:cytochrome c-type biogenesis protein CcmH